MANAEEAMAKTNWPHAHASPRATGGRSSASAHGPPPCRPRPTIHHAPCARVTLFRPYLCPKPMSRQS
ncbi:hypothetical protein BC834DRAFT_79715 [Gloeopeniophorella convolvens]|nr:hypothetical protein BC834DRAFT_79715 [Gloeopeniophorella convolvens]